MTVFNPFEFYWLRRHDATIDDASLKLTSSVREYDPKAVAVVTELSMKSGEGFSTIHRIQLCIGQFDVAAHSDDGWVWSVDARSRTNYQYLDGRLRFFTAHVFCRLGDALTLLAHIDSGSSGFGAVNDISVSWKYE